MILGLHGKMGAGKDEAAKRLALLAPIPVVRVAYADKLKKSAAALLGCSVDDLERWKNDSRVSLFLCDEIGPMMDEQQTIRSFLQRYGTEAHRDVFGQDFWLDAALPIGRDYSSALYVVTDVRFENEADRIHELGGRVARVVGVNEDTGTHLSEQVLACDFELDNRERGDDFKRLDWGLSVLLEEIL